MAVSSGRPGFRAGLGARSSHRHGAVLSPARARSVLTESERALDSLFDAYSYRRTGVPPDQVRGRLSPEYALGILHQPGRGREHEQVGDDDRAGEEVERRHETEVIGHDAGPERAE